MYSWKGKIKKSEANKPFYTVKLLIYLAKYKMSPVGKLIMLNILRLARK